MNLHIKYKSLLDKYGVNTHLRLAHFLSQITHESGLKSVRESGYYKDIKTLRAIFYSPFKGKSDAFVSSYLRNSIKCLSYVYANRMGNGDEASGDGYKFRGGGFLQNTGKNQYAKMTKKTGINFLENPDLITEEANALICALEFWKDNKLNEIADKDDLDAISDLINIGRDTVKVRDANGYKHRKELLDKYKKTFK